MKTINLATLIAIMWLILASGCSSNGETAVSDNGNPAASAQEPVVLGKSFENESMQLTISDYEIVKPDGLTDTICRTSETKGDRDKFCSEQIIFYVTILNKTDSTKTFYDAVAMLTDSQNIQIGTTVASAGIKILPNKKVETSLMFRKPDSLKGLTLYFPCEFDLEAECSLEAT